MRFSAKRFALVVFLVLMAFSLAIYSWMRIGTEHQPVSRQDSHSRSISQPTSTSELPQSPAKDAVRKDYRLNGKSPEGLSDHAKIRSEVSSFLGRQKFTEADIQYINFILADEQYSAAVVEWFDGVIDRNSANKTLAKLAKFMDMEVFDPIFNHVVSRMEIDQAFEVISALGVNRLNPATIDKLLLRWLDCGDPLVPLSWVEKQKYAGIKPEFWVQLAKVIAQDDPAHACKVAVGINLLQHRQRALQNIVLSRGASAVSLFADNGVGKEDAYSVGESLVQFGSQLSERYQVELVKYYGK